MNKQLSHRVSLIISAHLLVSVGGAYALDRDSSAVPCNLARSDRIPVELVSALRDELELNSSIKCKLLEVPITDPLGSSSSGLWAAPESSALWGLWMDRSNDGREFVVRGVDFQSHLQFGMNKATTHNLTTDSALEAFTRLAVSVVDQNSYQGVLQSKGFISWAPLEGDIGFFKDPVFDRHMLLPIRLDRSVSPKPMGRGRLVQDHLIVDPSVQRALDGGERLWLKLIHG